MPLKRFKFLAAAISLVATQWVSAAMIPYAVTAQNNLDNISEDIKANKKPGGYVISFGAYGSVGQLRLDAAAFNVDSLVLRRVNSDSDLSIIVDSTLLDLKNVKGKVILRGLAFQLNPKGTLLSSIAIGQENHNLLIDSCTIYADSLDGNFLNWLGDDTSDVRITNSFIVVRSAKSATKGIILSGGTMLFTNTLFNFPGLLKTTVNSKLEIYSNTFNRTQLQLTGTFYAGDYPVCNISQNLFAHHGTQDAFSLPQYWVAVISTFNTRSSVTANRRYSTWAGFDYQLPERYSNVNAIDSVFDGKAVTELWDWYTEVKDPNTGMLSGSGKHARFNVLPTLKSLKFPIGTKDTLTLNFRTALFPRQSAYAVDGKVYATDSTLRLRYPSLGALYFGSFRVDSITIPGAPLNGKPVLLAQNDSGKFLIQKSSSPDTGSPSRFVNNLPSARFFILADSTNTPRGSNITPGAKSKLVASERLRFKTVDTAGFTFVASDQTPTIPVNYRFLEKSLVVNTTAVMNTEATFGGVEGVTPFWGKEVKDSTVFWMISPNAFVLAEKSLIGTDAGLYMGKTQYNSTQGPLKVYLVEKLNVPRGETLIPIREGSVQVFSAKGYQLKIDTIPVPFDITRYGLGSQGYKFSWKGRVATDSLFLTLKASPEQVAYAQNDGHYDSLPLTRGNDGSFRIRIALADSIRTFFLAVQFNVTANVEVSSIDNVGLRGFKSSTGGNLSISGITQDTFDLQIVPNKDSAFKYTRFLGGITFHSSYLNLINSFGAILTVGEIKDSDNMEAWYYDGETWNKTSRTMVDTKTVYVVGLPTNTKKIVVIEKVGRPENYIETNFVPTPTAAPTSITVTTGYKNPLINQITGIRLQLQYLTGTGVEDTTTVKKAIGDSIQLPLPRDIPIFYRIQYFMGDSPITGSYELIPGTGWNADTLLKADTKLAVKEKYQWHLIGFPVSGMWDAIMHMDPSKPDESILDSTSVKKVVRDTLGNPKFETISKPDTLTIAGGEAFLFASARPYNLHVDSPVSVLPPKAVTRSVQKGWNFIANPFPTNFLVTRVKATKSSKQIFRRLARHGKDNYSWEEDSIPSLQAFVGYAYYAEENEELVFDPFAVPAAAKVASPDAIPDRLQAGLTFEGARSRMTLTTESGTVDVPVLPAPQAGAELRVGGKSGYMIKAVANAANIDEPMEIQASKAGTAAFTLLRLPKHGNTEAQPELLFRLVELRTGRIYDGASAGALPLEQGVQSYRLLAGDQAFITERTQGILAGAPGEIGLSQNYPNPAVGKTRIALDWPAWQKGDRHAVLEVLDMQGRSLERIRLENIRVGRQVITVDATGWKSGVYLYRLTVITDGRQARLQKRMLVSP
ncbi:MAG: hypothetical protein ABI036_14865 [Fibrobacteria bacterium]